MDEGDALMALGVDVFHQVPHTLNIVRLDGAAVFKDIVDGYHRDPAVHQFQHLGVRKFSRGDQNAVAVAVPGVLGIADLPSAQTVGDEGDIVAHLLGPVLEGVEDPGEKFVGQAGIGGIFKENAEIIGPAGLQGPGSGVGDVAHLLGCRANPLSGFGGDITGAVEGLADSGGGTAAALGDHADGDHRPSPFRTRPGKKDPNRAQVS